MLIVYLLLTMVALIYLWIKKRYNYWNERGFLCPPSSFPFGCVKGVGTSLNAFQLIENVYKKYKGKASAVGMFFFIHPTILLIDVELIKRVMVQDFSSFHDQGLYYNKEDDPLSAK